MQTEVANHIELKEKRISRYLLIYIAAMGMVSFFGVDPSAIIAGVLQLLIAIVLLGSKILQPEIRPFLLQHKWLSVIFLFWLMLAVNAGINSPVLEKEDALVAVVSWTRLFYFFSLFIFGFAIYLFFRRVPLQQERLVKAMVIIMLAIIINMLLAYQLHPDFRDAFVWANTPPGYANIRHAGYHVFIVSIFLLFLLHRLVGWKEQVLFTTLLICFWAFNFWMGGRGSVLAALLGSFIFIGMLYWKGRALKRVFLSLLIAISLGFLLSEFFVVFDWNGFLTAYKETVDAVSAERLSAGRTTLWMSALDLIKENYFSGIGTGVYRYTEGYVSLSHPHNFILQFAVDWGVPGALCAIFLLAGFFLKGLLQHVKLESDVSIFSLCCGAVVFALLALGMIDGTLYHTQPTFYFMFAMVFWLLGSATPKFEK